MKGTGMSDYREMLLAFEAVRGALVDCRDGKPDPAKIDAALAKLDAHENKFRAGTHTFITMSSIGEQINQARYFERTSK